MSRIVEAVCKSCQEKAGTPLSPEDVERMSVPGSGHAIMDQPGWKLIVGYCPDCLSQLAWLVMDGETSFAKIEWKKL